MNSSIVLKTLAALAGISEPVYACIEINWTVLKRPITVAAETPETALDVIDVTARPVALLAVDCAFLVVLKAQSDSETCLGIYWIRIRELGSKSALSDTRTKNAGLLKLTSTMSRSMPLETRSGSSNRSRKLMNRSLTSSILVR